MLEELNDEAAKREGPMCYALLKAVRQNLDRFNEADVREWYLAAAAPPAGLDDFSAADRGAALAAAAEAPATYPSRPGSGKRASA